MADGLPAPVAGAPEPSLGRRMLSGAAWAQGGQMVAFAMQMLLQIVLARGLGTAEYGVFAVLNGTVFLVVALASGGASGTLNTHLSRLTQHYGRAEAAYLFWRLWAWRLVTFGGIAMAVALFAGPVAGAFLGDPDRGELMVAGVVYMFAIGMFQIANLLFYGLLMTKWAAFGAALSAFANVYVSSILIWQGASLTTIVWALAGSQLLVCLLQLARGWPYVRPAIGVRRVGPEARRDVRALWRFSLTVWAIALLTQALGKQTDLIMMQFFRVDQAEIGFYNIAVTLGLAANAIFLMGIGNVALAGLSSLNARAPERLGRGWQALCAVAPLISLPMLLFVGVFAEPIIGALYGGAYRDAALLLQIFVAFAIVSQLLGGGAHQTALTAMGMPRRVLRARGVTGVLNLALNVALIPFFGARGAVVGTGLCGTLTILYEYTLVRRELRERLPWRSYARAAVCFVPGMVPAWFLAPHLGLAGVVAAGAVYLLSYLGVVVLLRPVAVDSEVASALPRLARRLVRVEERRPAAGAARPSAVGRGPRSVT